MRVRKKCIVEGCLNIRQVKGLCWKHHNAQNIIPKSPRLTQKQRGYNGCSIPGCEKPYVALGYCNQHYKAYRTHGDPLTNLKSNQVPCKGNLCAYEACDEEARSKGFCTIHYMDYWRGIEIGSQRIRIRDHKDGDKRIDSHGYILIYKPTKPWRNKKDKHWYREHRIVMEEHLGRELYDYEEVHHKNGIKSDNSIENLELWVKSHPAGQRAIDLLEWAEAIVYQYSPRKSLLQ